MALTDKLTTIANAIRSKTGKSDALTLDQMATEIESISAGGGPTEEWIGDGNMHIWITLPEGRTSPMLGVAIKGTATVDWGDGTTPDTLTGNSLASTQWTPTHNYAKAGDYVITLTVDGDIVIEGSSYTNQHSRILRYATGEDYRNRAYLYSIKKVELCDSVTRIGNYAFHTCSSLSSVFIPDSVTSIDLSAFAHCSSLSSVVIPNSVTSIGDYAFTYCRALSSIVIPNSVTSIGHDVFASCSSLSSIVIPNSVTSIGSSDFSSCITLSSVVIPDSVTSIGGSAFASCSLLSSIVIPDSVTSIGSSAFKSCSSLSSIVIPDSVTSIGNYTFYGCSLLSSVVIPNSVTSIGGDAFLQCYTLSSVVIPNSVTSIGDSAFSACYAVTFYDFTKHTTIPTLSSKNAFNGILSDCEIRVPAALYDEWIAATNWSTYADKIVAV